MRSTEAIAKGRVPMRMAMGPVTAPRVMPMSV